MKINVIAQLVAVSGGFAWAPPADLIQGLTCADPGAPTRPAQQGDFLSVQPDGSLQTRTKAGPWETFTIQGPYFVYTTDGSRTALILPPGL